MGDEGRDDPDRAAILARRQRFIALALSGLSASCGGEESKPQPCLDIAPMTESTGDDGMTGPVTGSSSDTGSSGMPMPCLDIGPMTESTATVDDTGTESTGTDSTGTDSTGDSGTTSG